MIYNVAQLMVDLCAVQNKADLMAMRATCVGARDAWNAHPYVVYIIAKLKRSLALDRALQLLALELPTLRWTSLVELEACVVGRNAARGYTEGRMIHLDNAVDGLLLLDRCMCMHAKSDSVAACADSADRDRIQHLLKMFDFA